MINMKKFLLLFILAIAFIPQSKAEATAYYIDFNCGATATCGNGLATTTSFSGIDAFAEVARSAGDIAFVRRGVASTTGISDIAPTSEGVRNNPIIITADYDNLWNDFATSSQTYTVAAASTTMTASGSITGIAAGDWIYVAGDCGETYNSTVLNKCEFAYEVSAVSGTNLTLFLPYKGNQSGSGLDLRVMPDAPQWNTTTGDFQWLLSTPDQFWYLKGLDLRGTDSNCVISLGSNGVATDFVAYDMVLQSDNTTSCSHLGGGETVSYTKTRTLGGSVAGSGAFVQMWGIVIKDFLVNCNGSSGVAFRFGGATPPSGRGFISEGSISGCAEAFIFNSQATHGGVALYVSNLRFGTFSVQYSGAANQLPIYFEDKYGIVGMNSYTNSFIDSNTTATTTAATSTLRSGGGPTAWEVNPPSGNASTGISTNYFPYTYIPIFELPIYTDTTSRTYEIYFKTATSTAQWTTNPTTEELWIECEYWANSAGNNIKKVKKTTSTVDFSGSSSWQSLAVSCQPTQSGVLKLRGFYAKPRESGKTNSFLFDPTPVITP